MQSDIFKSQISLFAPQGSRIRNSINDIGEIKKFKQKRLIMEVKEAYFSGKHIGYYFYFKKIKFSNENNINFNKSKIMNISPKIKSNLKRPSVKFINFEEESAKSSRIYNDEEASSILDKIIDESPKRNSIVNFDLENIYIHKKKNESSKIGFDPVKEHDRSIATRSFIGAKTKKMQARVKSFEQRIGREIEY